MERKSVTSSDLRSVGYEATSQTLEVEFQDGSVYRYYDVPLATYEGLMAGPSHGKYFHRYIKKQFRSEKVL